MSAFVDSLAASHDYGVSGKHLRGLMMLRKLLFTGAAAIALTGAAQAADIIEPTAYDWSGPYIGLQAGYAWGEEDTDLSVVAAPAPFEIDSIDLDGFVGGIHLGHNWQSDSFVFGIVADGEFADIDGDADISLGANPPFASAEEDIDWLASLRLRAGFALDRTLIYATGGLAVGGVELQVSPQGQGIGQTQDTDDTLWGWTIGGGIEYALSDALSAFVEYRWTDLGDIDLSAGGDKIEADVNFHAVRGGISWHFGPI